MSVPIWILYSKQFCVEYLDNLPSWKVVTQNQFAVKLICKRAFNRLESVHVKWLPDKDQFLLVHLTRSLTGKRTGVIANFFGV